MAHVRLYMASAAIALIALTIAPAGAEDRDADRPADRSAQKPLDAANIDTASSMHFKRASQCLGVEVRDSAGKDIGDVHDIVLRPDGRIAYVVIAHGGALGVGQTLSPVPLRALKPVGAQDDKAVQIAVSEAELKDVPHIQSDAWPSGADRNWRDTLDRTYKLQEQPDPEKVRRDALERQENRENAERAARDGDRAAENIRQRERGVDAADRADTDRDATDRDRPADTVASNRIYRVSQLIGLNVKDAAGEEFAEINDILLDRDAACATFVLLEYGGTLGVGDKLAAAPFSSISVTMGEEANAAPQVATLNATRAKLDANVITKEQVDALAGRDRAAEVYRSYEQTPYWETFGVERDREHDADSDRPKPDANRPQPKAPPQP